jgi:hypothetical protein
MVDVVASPARDNKSYVEWSAVFAGAVAASAISFVLLTAGAAIGLSLVSPYAGASYGKTAAAMMLPLTKCSSATACTACWCGP